MSYTLNYTGSEIDDILDRAAPSGALDTAIAAKQDALTFDAVPTEGSTNPAESGGIYDAIQAGGATALAAFATDSVSGDIVSFPDGADGIPVKNFVGSIVPQQDLHGQSAPYPAGGGANKVDQSTLTNTGVVSDTGATGTQTTRLFSALFPVTPSTTYYAGVDGKSSNNETIQFNRFIWFDSSKNFISRSSTGQSTTGVNITTPANAYYASIDLRTPALTTNLVAANVTKLWFAVGSGTVAYSPYSNICPISGWSGANIYRAGANVTPTLPQIVQGAINATTGQNLESAYRVRTYFIPVEPSTTYSIYTNVEYMYTFEYSSVNLASFIKSSGWTRGIKTITTDANTHQLRLALAHSSTSSGSGAIEIVPSEITQIVISPTIDTIVLSFGQTVYAGTLTALGGGLWSVQPTMAYRALTGTESFSTYSPVPNSVSLVLTGLTPNIKASADIISDRYPHQSISGGDAINVGNSALYIRDTVNCADATVYTAYLAAQYAAGTPVEILYEPATLPDPIIVSAEDLQTLLGANTVWTDVGSVTELEYRADTALYIQKLLNGGGSLSLSMASPSPSLSLGRVGVLAEPEAEAVPEPDDAEPEAEETTEEQEEQEAEEE